MELREMIELNDADLDTVAAGAPLITVDVRDVNVDIIEDSVNNNKVLVGVNVLGKQRGNID